MIRAARIFAPVSTLRLALMDATVVATVFFVLVRLTIAMDATLFFWEEHGALKLAPVILILILTMYFGGLYERKRIESRIYLLQQLCLSAGVALVSQALLSYVYDRLILPRNLALYGLIGSLLALFVWRLVRDALLSSLQGTGTVIILGTDETGHRIARHIGSHPAMHLRVVGSLTNRPEKAVAPVLGGIEDLHEVAVRLKPDMIIAGLFDARDRMPVSDMVDLRYGGARIEEAGPACELICHYVSARDLRPSRILFSGDFDEKDIPPAVYITDTLVSALLLIVGAPFAVLYACLLKLSGVKRVIRREICIGYRGKRLVSRRLHIPGKGILSSLGRGLNLEDWPQLWNVFTGRMSMVGPRPHRVTLAAELNRIFPIHEYRQNARPGITGWAQINLKEEPGVIDTIREVEYDLYYVRNQSASLYTYILLHGARVAI